jgi:hypothetical protein
VNIEPANSLQYFIKYKLYGYKFCLENPEDKRSLGKLRRRWKDDIKTDIVDSPGSV